MSDAFVAGAGAASTPPSTSNAAAAASSGEEHRQEELADCKADAPSGNTSNGDSALPQLPAGDPNDMSVPVLKLGEKMTFAEMGPVIINADGTTRQIANWDRMTTKEQEVTWRRISKRNAERRAKLEEQMRAEMQATEGETGEKEKS